MISDGEGSKRPGSLTEGGGGEPGSWMDIDRDRVAWIFSACVITELVWEPGMNLLYPDLSGYFSSLTLIGSENECVSVEQKKPYKSVAIL